MGDPGLTVGPAVHLRDFEPDDQAPCWQLVQAGLADRWGDAFDPAYNTDLDDIAATYTTGDDCFVVALIDDEIVGTGALVREGDDVARILRMSVAGTFRRRGIARAIVDELVGRARAASVGTVLVSTDTPWTSAVALYRSCGFTEIGEDGVDTHFELSL